MSLALIEGFKEGMRPPAQMSFAEWARKYVRVVDGKAPYYDPEQTPHVLEPMERMVDADTREILLVWPTGSGKSTLFEAWFCYVIAEAPKSIQVSLNNDLAASRWMEKRVLPAIERCEPCRPILDATHRHKKRKMELLLPNGMALYAGGASEGKLQDVSVPLTLGQETWCWREGQLAQAKARCHDRYNAKAVFAGQSGVIGSEFHAEELQCELRTFHFRCPKCKSSAPWIQPGSDPRVAFEAAMEWDQDEADKDSPDWAKVHRSVRLVTGCCGHKFKDLPTNRRKLCLTGHYVVTRPGGVPGWVAYTFPAMALAWVSWSSLVQEYVLARRSEMAGDPSRIQSFVMKRLAWWWEERLETPTFDVDRDRYSKGDYWPDAGERAPKWPQEIARFMTIDVQKGWFVVVVRAWDIEGNSILIYESPRIESIELVRELQHRLEVPNAAVGIDIGYNPDQVAKWRLKFRDPVKKDGEVVSYQYWMCLKGDQGAGYPSRPGGPRRPFSYFVNSQSTEGIGYRLVKFSTLLCKDTLAGLMEADTRYWGVPHDHSAEYKDQMESENKQEVAPGKYMWKRLKTKGANHLWDCETMQVAMACIRRVLKVEIDPVTNT